MEGRRGRPPRHAAARPLPRPAAARCSWASCSTPCSPPAWARSSRCCCCAGAWSAAASGRRPRRCWARWSPRTWSPRSPGSSWSWRSASSCPCPPTPGSPRSPWAPRAWPWSLVALLSGPGHSQLPPWLNTGPLWARATRAVTRLWGAVRESHLGLRDPRQMSVVVGASLAPGSPSGWASTSPSGRSGSSASAGAAPGLLLVTVTLAQAFPVLPGNLLVFQAAAVVPLTASYGVAAAEALAFSIVLQATEAIVGRGRGLPVPDRRGRRVRPAPPAGRGGERAAAITPPRRHHPWTPWRAPRTPGAPKERRVRFPIGSRGEQAWKHASAPRSGSRFPIGTQRL